MSVALQHNLQHASHGHDDHYRQDEVKSVWGGVKTKKLVVTSNSNRVTTTITTKSVPFADILARRDFASQRVTRVATFADSFDAAPATTTATLPAATFADLPVAAGERVPERFGVRVPGPPVECQVVFVKQSRSWLFDLAPESTVQDGIMSVTSQVLKIVFDTGHVVDEKLSVRVHPAVSDGTTVGEWASRTDQTPTIIMQDVHEEEDLGSQNPEFDAQNLERTMEEQTKVLLALQRQLGEQSAIIRNQASFITDLQAKERQRSGVLGETVLTMKDDIADVKGKLFGLEGLMTDGSRGEGHRNGRA